MVFRTRRAVFECREEASQGRTRLKELIKNLKHLKNKEVYSMTKTPTKMRLLILFLCFFFHLEIDQSMNKV